MTSIAYEFRLAYSPQHDPWGACMGALFDICNELSHRGDDNLIPDAFGYSTGAGGPYPRDEQAWQWEGYDSADLALFAENYLWRLRGICKRRGWAY